MQWLTYWDASALWTFLPEELERVESLFGGAMLRIYTRRFMGEMISRNIELRTPFMDPAPVEKPICR